MARTIQGQLRACGRAQWSLSIVTLMLVVTFYGLGYRPNNSRLEEMRAEIAQKRRILDDSQNRTKNLAATAVQVNELRQTLDGFDKKLPKQQDLAPFMNDITELKREASLRRWLVEAGMPRRTDQFAESPITLKFEGDFVNVFNFLRRTEELERLTRVKRLSLKCKEGKASGSGQVDVVLSMNIYSADE